MRRHLLALALSTLFGAAQAADLSRAVEIVEGKCFICHGVEGESSSPVFPRLAGQHAALGSLALFITPVGSSIVEGQQQKGEAVIHFTTRQA